MKSNSTARFILGILRHPSQAFQRYRELRRIAKEPPLESQIPMDKFAYVELHEATENSELHEQLVELYANNPSPYVNGPMTIEKLRECLSRGVRYFLVANDKGDYVGARAFDPGKAFLQNAITDHRFRGKGYQVAAGHALLVLLAGEGYSEVGTTVFKSNSRMQRVMIARGWEMSPDAHNPELIRGVLKLDTIVDLRKSA